MADYIKKIRTEKGDLQIDYEALANLPVMDTTLTKSGGIADAKAVGDAINVVSDALDQKADISDIPTKLSQLTNDIGLSGSTSDDYITETEFATTLVSYVTTTQLNNKGYVTSTELDSKGYLTEAELDSKGYLTAEELEGQGFIVDIPVASASAVGGVKPGDGLEISSDGTLSLADDAEVMWSNIVDKPSTFPPVGHTLHSHIDVNVCDSMPTNLTEGNWYLVKAE